MVTYAPHVKLTMQGEFRNAANAKIEEFVMTTSWGNISGADVAEASLEPIMDNLATACETFWDTADLKQSALSVLTLVKIARIGANGRYPADANAHLREVSQAGPSGGTAYPTETALAVSLRTGERGTSKRGRFYLPMPQANLTAFTLTPADAEAIATACQSQLLGNTAGTIGGVMAGLTAGGQPYQLVVASSKGYITPVTVVNVGVVPDVQRRRRNKLPENYQVG